MWYDAAAPATGSRACCTVSRIWMPATTPTWATICWAALTTPRSFSSTELAMAAANAGEAVPMPTPDRARAPMITRSEVPTPTVDSATIDPTMKRAPATAFVRSPTFTVR